MIRPQRSFIIACSTCWIARNAPVRLVASTASQSSFFMRIARPSLVMPALLTRMSTLPALENASLIDSATPDRWRRSVARGNLHAPLLPVSLRPARPG